MVTIMIDAFLMVSDGFTKSGICNLSVPSAHTSFGFKIFPTFIHWKTVN